MCLCISLLGLLFVSNPAEPHHADHYQSPWCSFWIHSNANIATFPLKGHFEHTVPHTGKHTVLSLLFNTADVNISTCCHNMCYCWRNAVPKRKKRKKTDSPLGRKCAVPRPPAPSVTYHLEHLSLIVISCHVAWSWSYWHRCWINIQWKQPFGRYVRDTCDCAAFLFTPFLDFFAPLTSLPFWP